MSTFTKFSYGESPVEALPLTQDTAPTIIASLMDDLKAFKLSELKIELSGSEYTITFRFKSSTISQTLVYGQYLIKRVVGDKIVMNASDFLSTHVLWEPDPQITELQNALATEQARVQELEKIIETMPEIGELQTQLAESQKRITELQTQITTMQGELDAARDAKEQAEADLVEVNTELDATKVALSDSQLVAASAQARVTTLEAEVVALQKRIDELTAIVRETVAVTVDTPNPYSEPTKDVLLTSATPLDTSRTFTGKSIRTQDLGYTSSKLTLTAATGDIEMFNISNSGTLEKAISNAALIVNTNGAVRIEGGTLEQNGYNAIEIGLASGVTPKSVDIENVTFSNLSNNAISIFDQADGAVINIKGCHFTATAPYVLRISNRSNNTCTINFIDCTVDAMAPDAAYSGFLLFQDYITPAPADAAAANRFSAEKITVNFVNVTRPDGTKLVAPADPATAYGSGDANQIMYVYDQAIVPYAGNEGRYPTVTYS